MIARETNGCSDAHVLLLAVVNIGRLAIEACLIHSGSIVASNGNQFCAIWSIGEIRRACSMRRATTYSELRSCRHYFEIAKVNALGLSKMMVVLTLEDAI